MLRYNLIKNEENKLTYEYFVEGRKEERGICFIDLATGEAQVEKLAKTDEFSWYAFHLLSTLRSQYKENNFLDSGMVAWY